MRRLKREPGTFDLLHAVDALTRLKGLRIRDPAAASEAFQDLRSSFERRQTDDKFFYGQRAETLFAYVAAALGGCSLIKHEDAGELYTIEDGLRIPDYRLVTTTGAQLLVEVKNFHEINAQRPYELRAADLDGLRRYAAICHCDLYIAIYWSRWKQWTLVKPSDLRLDGSVYSISLLEAIPRNRMAVLGDHMIGTVPSLSLRLLGSTDDNQSTGESDLYRFTTRTAELRCKDQLIEDPLEQRIAIFLMLNGDWEVTENSAELDNERLAAVRFVVAPRERANPDQEFEIVGRLSDMISRQFDAATVKDGEIINIAPGAEPEQFGVAIPVDYTGSVLRLWRLVQQVKD